MHKYNIAICGAFDIVSYGDSLFPIALDYEMQKRLDEYNKIIWFSPLGCKQSYGKGEKVYSYKEFEICNDQYHFDLIVIGGGELLHFRPITFHDQNGKQVIYEVGQLWQTPIDFAKKKNIPYIINAVGAPYSFGLEEGRCIRKYLESAAYISVRDIYSQKRLTAVGVESELVPDSLWNMPRYVKSVPVIEKDYIVIQYGTLFQIEKLFDVIRNLKNKFGKEIVILPINYCHDDRVIVERTKEYLENDVITYDSQLSIEEIYNLITKSSMFIGTSLHGTITALSNYVPALILDMYPYLVGKMDGLHIWLNGKLKMVSDMQSIEYMVQCILNEKKEKRQIEIDKLQKKTDEHFDKIADVIKMQ